MDYNRCKKHYLPAYIVLLLLLIVLLGAGCNGAQDQPSQQEQVSRGETVYVDECARCHDPGGIGPQLEAANLSDYGTAQRLFNYTSSTMPQDNPGSLTDQQYWDVTAHILFQEGMLPEDVVLGPETAGDISLSP